MFHASHQVVRVLRPRWTRGGHESSGWHRVLNFQSCLVHPWMTVCVTGCITQPSIHLILGTCSSLVPTAGTFHDEREGLGDRLHFTGGARLSQRTGRRKVAIASIRRSLGDPHPELPSDTNPPGRTSGCCPICECLSCFCAPHEIRRSAQPLVRVSFRFDRHTSPGRLQGNTWLVIRATVPFTDVPAVTSA